jgi:hypothetical protein
MPPARNAIRGGGIPVATAKITPTMRTTTTLAATHRIR